MKLFTFLVFFFTVAPVWAQPSTGAPVPPPRNATDVVSIYGDVYTNISDINYNPNWGQSGTVDIAFDPGDGNLAMAYTNFNYQGTGFETNVQNASAMEFIHIDIWTSNATVVLFTPIDMSGVGPAEVLVSVPLVAGEWSSVDIPKSAFTGMSWNAVFQLKFDGQAGTTPSDIYLDNIYFWKNPVSADTDVTLSELQVDGAALPGFTPSAFNYTYGIPGGAAIPQITLATTTNPAATVTAINQAAAVPGDATVLVTAANGITMGTYTISYFYNSPATAAPAPTTTGDVISLFSDAYTNVNVDFWNTSWSAAVYEEVLIEGNPTKKYTSLGFNGVETTTEPVDASAMNYLHFDAWTPNITMLNMKLVSFLGDGFGGANGDTESNLNIGLSAGEWNHVQIPLADFIAAGLTDLSDLNQYIFTSDPFGSGTLYLDNIYFSVEAVSVDAPTVAAPTPTETNVISLFSDAYTNVNVDFWNTSWSAAVYEEVQIAGNPTKKYTDVGFNGIETTTEPVDASAMMFLHMDVWTPNITTLNMKLVSFLGDGFGGANGDTESNINISLTAGEWNSLKIPLSDFTAAGLTDLSDLNQYIFTSDPFGTGILYLDNMYFSAEGGVIEEPLVAAPTPTETNVISLFSDAYTNVNVDFWNTSWSAAVYEEVQIAGNPTKKYTDVGFNGIETTTEPVDASAMMFLHMDVWTPNITTLNMKLVSFLGDGFGGANGDTESNINISLTAGVWNSLKIPLSDFTAAGLTDLSDLNQYIFTSDPFGTGILYLDNLFFSAEGGVIEEPLVAAPTPTETNVISLFSDAYTNVNVDFWNTSWSAAVYEEVQIAGNPTKKYTDVGFNGIETTTEPVDASAMMFLHMDVWTPNITTLNMKLVSFLGDGFAGPNGDSESNLNISLTAGEWNSLKIPLSDFTAAGLTDLSDLNQYIFTSDPFGTGILYLDNLFFSAEPNSTEEAGIENSKAIIYPNPVHSGGQLFVKAEVTRADIYDLNGQKIWTTNTPIINLQGLGKGVYMVKITDKKGAVHTEKLVVQ